MTLIRVDTFTMLIKFLIQPILFYAILYTETETRVAILTKMEKFRKLALIILCTYFSILFSSDIS